MINNVKCINPQNIYDGTACRPLRAYMLHPCDTFIKTKAPANFKGRLDKTLDNTYRNKIAESMGLIGVSAEDLASIMGPVEFKQTIIENSENETFYQPGKRPEGMEDKPDTYGLENVDNKTFGANLHIHTTASDGKLSAEELLNQAAQYADKYAEANNKPFTIAITDHNTIEGCREAARVIAQNPKKYKNLKVVLGVEISTKENKISKFEFLKPQSFHILSMCINPFDEKLDKFFFDLNEGKKNPMFPKTIGIKEATEGFIGQENNYFCFAHPAYPNIKKRLKEGKDYLKATEDSIKYFKQCAGKKALYAETYYGGYYGDMATDKELHKTIKNAVKKNRMYNAGGIDTHGTSIFYNGVKELKAQEEAKKLAKKKETENKKEGSNSRFE